MSEKDDSDAGLLFRELVGKVKPLSGDAKVRLQQRSASSPGLKARRQAAASSLEIPSDGLSSVDHVKMLDPHAVLSFKRPGVQHGVFKNLRLGKYPLETRIDLHRMTIEQSRQQLVRFVRDCQNHSVRCALITHGKGLARERFGSRGTIAE